MNKNAPYEYLVNLVEWYKMLTEEEKPALMPCYYKNNLKIRNLFIVSLIVTLVITGLNYYVVCYVERLPPEGTQIGTKYLVLGMLRENR